MPTPSDSNDQLRDVTEDGHTRDFRPATPGEQQAHDDILRVLSDFQTGLESLKHLYAQREILQAELLAQREALALRDRRLEEQRAAFEAEHAELVARREELAAKDAQLAEQAREYDLAVAQLAERQQALAERDTAMTRQAADLAAAHEQVEAQRSVVARQTEELAAARALIEQQRAVLSAKDADLARQADVLRERERDLSAREADLHEARSRLTAREREVAQLREALANAGDSASTQTQRAVALAEEVALLRVRGDLLFDLAQEYESLWHTERHASGVLLVEAQSLRAAMAELETQTRDLQDRLADAASVAVDLERERTACQELEGSLATAQGRLAAEVARREAEARRADEAEALLAERARMLQAAAEGLAQARGLAQAQAESLAKVNEENARLRALGPGRCDAFNRARRERLGKVRIALRRQVKKVRMANEALGKRMEQVDQVLAQRADLAQARHRIIEAERRVQKAASRNKVGVFCLCLVAALCMLAGLSWAIAREVAPATFVAEVSIRADGRGRDLNDAELQEWKRYHLELLGNPMFQEAAAERFMRQGVASLGTASAVAALVNTSIHADSMAPGEITLLHTGSGKDATRRTLEAFSASLASFANAAMQRRIDGAATVVPAPARVDDAPTDKTRSIYALVILGLGVLGVGSTSIVVWRRLASAKSSFEHDSQVAGILDEARWSTPGRA